MNKEPATCPPDTSIDEAVQLMKDNKIRQLVITEKDRLVGVISDVDLQHLMPSPATTLSAHELTYLLSKETVFKYMNKEVVTVSPDTTIERAALLMHDQDISGLPVVKEGRVVGHINRTIMLSIFVEEMGQKVESSRITLELEDKPGVILDITKIIKGQGLNIVSVATFFHDSPGKRIVVFRLGTSDVSAVKAELTAGGYRIVTAKDFNL
jgi:acetoin utilization protein AcuB